MVFEKRYTFSCSSVMIYFLLFFCLVNKIACSSQSFDLQNIEKMVRDRLNVLDDDTHFQELKEIGHPIVPTIVKLLKEENIIHRLLLIQLLGEMGPKSFFAIPTLIEIVENAENKREIESAIRALGKIGLENDQ